MLLAGAFAIVLFIGLIVGDWMYFARLSSEASRYGYGIGQVQDQVGALTVEQLVRSCDTNGFLSLPHGVARVFPEANRMVIRPTCRLFSMRFRTAWPLKGSIEWAPEADGLRLICTKRVPWSSSILTFLWFGLVGFGTLGFLINYLLQGGLESLGGLLLGVGVTGVGVIVVAFGLLTVTVAYRIENTRLMQVYTEFRTAALQGKGAA
ncbi:MAG: hypothetical protein OJF47_002552 [Nitrospira sp.]|jgi:TM2 domain-containing membrane protein YozV|nr:MAG: hypothetical protein OJF47_002552 [Nitrospira sp.]